jgi:hypothetical protein
MLQPHYVSILHLTVLITTTEHALLTLFQLRGVYEKPGVVIHVAIIK